VSVKPKREKRECKDCDHEAYTGPFFDYEVMMMKHGKTSRGKVVQRFGVVRGDAGQG
jgi:hypothetical protein